MSWCFILWEYKENYASNISRKSALVPCVLKNDAA